MRYIRWLLTLALILPSALAGQSIIGASGLGMRLEPLDAVQRALGGVGVTTRTPTVLPGNPAASLDILAPTITFTVQPHWGRYKVGSEKGNFLGTRFPVLGFAYPLGTNAVLTATAGSQFDQNWSVESRDSVDVRGESVGFTDTFLSDGAVTAIQVGWARRWSTTFALGATVGVYRGGLTRSFTRAFDREAADSVTLENPIAPFGAGGRWSHSGPLASLNLSWDPSPVLQLGATVAWGGTLKVSPGEGGPSVSREVSVPLEFKVSTVAVLRPTLALNLGATFSNWSDLGETSVEDAGAGKVASYGVGVEWDRINFWAGSLPVRLGFRQSDLPFRFLENKVRESAISFGFTVVMAQALDLPLAAIDAAIEVGNRTSGDFEESFRRFTVTTRVGGF
jgi:hypothetical protein